MRYSLLFFAAGSGGAGAYDLLLDAVRLIDDSRVEAVWLPERHFDRFGGPYPNPAVLGAAVAAGTRQVRIRAGSVILPLHDTLRVAEEWSVVDNLSNGRVEISFGSGWNVNDFVLAPERYERRRELLPEGIDTVRRLWRGETVTRVNGAGNPVPVATLPRPVQPELPVWLTAQSEATIRSAAGSELPVLTNLNFNSPQVLARNCQAYRASLPARPGPRPRLAVMAHTYLGETAESARACATGPLREYLRANLDLRAAFADGKSAQPTDGGATSRAVDPETVNAIIERGADRILGWAGLIGDRKSVAEKVRHLAELGVDELACLVDFGIGADQVRDGIARLCALADETSGD